MKKVVISIEFILGDLPDAEREEIEKSLPIIAEDVEEEDEEAFETIPRIDEYDDSEVAEVMCEVFGDFGLTDPDNSAEIFAGTNFYGTIAKSRVLSCFVESVNDA